MLKRKEGGVGRGGGAVTLVWSLFTICIDAVGVFSVPRSHREATDICNKKNKFFVWLLQKYAVQIIRKAVDRVGGFCYEYMCMI